jgi:hypothetical protein
MALLAGVGVAFAVYRARTRDERLRRERVEAITRLWRHPDRVARKQRGLLFRIARAVVVSAATAAAVVIARRGVQRVQWALAPGRPAAAELPEATAEPSTAVTERPTG